MPQIWKFKRVISYLDYHGIAVVVKDGKPRLQKPPHMPQGVYLKLLDPILESVSEYRIDILEHFVPYEERPRDPDIIYRDTPAKELRRLLWQRWLKYRADYGGKLYGYSCYTRTLDPVPDPAPENPERHWSKLVLEVDGHRHDTRIPNHSPPRFSVRRGKKVMRVWWKPPKGWKPERDWLRPKDFKVPKPVRVRRGNPWSEQLTYKGQLPD